MALTQDSVLDTLYQVHIQVGTVTKQKEVKFNVTCHCL